MINIEYLKEFKLPIQYIDHKLTNDTIKDDLELVNFKNNDKDIDEMNNKNNNIEKYNYKDNTRKSIYEHIFEPNHLFSKTTTNLWSNYYTTDISFLTQTQKIIKHFNIVDYSYNIYNFDDVYDIFNNITTDNNFIEKYQYIDISYFKRFNDNQHVLQTISVINLSSPLKGMCSRTEIKTTASSLSADNASQKAIMVAISSNLILSGCLHPQPFSVASPQRLIPAQRLLT